MLLNLQLYSLKRDAELVSMRAGFGKSECFFSAPELSSLNLENNTPVSLLFLFFYLKIFDVCFLAMKKQFQYSLTKLFPTGRYFFLIENRIIKLP